MRERKAPWALVRALRTVRFKDSQPFRQSMFTYLAGRRRLVGVVLAGHALVRGSAVATLAISAYGLLPLFTTTAPTAPARVWAVGVYRNEQRQFDFVARCLGEGRVARVGTRPNLRSVLSGLVGLAGVIGAPSTARRYRALVRRSDRERGFLVACRVAATFGYYCRALDLLDHAGSGVSTVLVSSDSNPYAMGFVAAARQRGLNVAYIPHGHLPEEPPVLDADLALFDGPALEAVYRRAGPLTATIVYKGAEGDYRPMRTAGLGGRRFTLGIFMSILVDWAAFGGLLTRIDAALRPERIVVRFHPNTTIRDPAARRHVPALPHLEFSDGATILTDDAARCDLVLAGNSSCHLTLLKFGVPTAYVRGLDVVPHDFYRFISDGLIPGFDRPEDLDVRRVAAFFEAPTWAETYRTYDATYPAADSSSLLADAAVSQAITAAFDALENRPVP